MVSGENAARHRLAMVNILSRYYAGDGSLHDEIEANAISTAPVAEMARNALAGEGAVENPKKRARVDVSSFCTEVSTLLRSLETEITGQLRDIATGQENVAAICALVDAKQDNIYQRLFDLTKELEKEKAVNEANCQSMIKLHQELMNITTQLKSEKDRNENIHREYSAELKARQMQIERQTCAIAHLNNTIRAKDAQLEKAKGVSDEVNQKLDRIVRGLNL
jgi:hypothetical protein